MQMNYYFLRQSKLAANLFVVILLYIPGKVNNFSTQNRPQVEKFTSGSPRRQYMLGRIFKNKKRPRRDTPRFTRSFGESLRARKGGAIWHRSGLKNTCFVRFHTAVTAVYDETRPGATAPFLEDQLAIDNLRLAARVPSPAVYVLYVLFVLFAL